MKALHKEGFIGHVKEVIGISVGSLFALLWVLGYTVKQIEEIAVTFDFSVLQNINPESVFSFPTTFGLDNGERLESFIGSVLHQKGFSADATFEDIHRTCPIHIRCFATELQTGRLRHFSTTATPKTSVRFALRASMSVPIFYTPVQEPGGAVLVDGAILNNLPLVFMSPAEIEETWCAYFTRDDSEGEKLPPINSLTQLLKLVFESMVAMKSSPFLKKFRDRIVCIPIDVSNSLEFGQGETARRGIVKKGYEMTMEFLLGRPSTKHRRFSAS